MKLPNSNFFKNYKIPMVIKNGHFRAVAFPALATLLGGAFFFNNCPPASAAINYWEAKYFPSGYYETSETGGKQPFGTYWTEGNYDDPHDAGFVNTGFAKTSGSTSSIVRWHGDPSVPVSTKLLLVQRMEAFSTITLEGGGDLQAVLGAAEQNTFSSLGGDFEDQFSTGNGYAQWTRISTGIKIHIIDNPDRKTTIPVPQVSGYATSKVDQLPEGVSSSNNVRI